MFIRARVAAWPVEKNRGVIRSMMSFLYLILRMHLFSLLFSLETMSVMASSSDRVGLSSVGQMTFGGRLL